MLLIEVCISVCYIASGCLLFSGLNQDDTMWLILGSIYLSYYLHSALGYYKIFAILYPIIRTYFTRRAMERVNARDNTIIAIDRSTEKA